MRLCSVSPAQSSASKEAMRGPVGSPSPRRSPLSPLNKVPNACVVKGKPSKADAAVETVWSEAQGHLPVCVDSLHQEWDFERQLGRGTQAEVWLVRSKRSPATAAVKLLRKCTDAKAELDAYTLHRTEPLNRQRDGSCVVDLTVGGDKAT